MQPSSSRSPPPLHSPFARLDDKTHQQQRELVVVSERATTTRGPARQNAEDNNHQPQQQHLDHYYSSGGRTTRATSRKIRRLFNNNGGEEEEDSGDADDGDGDGDGIYGIPRSISIINATTPAGTTRSSNRSIDTDITTHGYNSLVFSSSRSTTKIPMKKKKTAISIPSRATKKRSEVTPSASKMMITTITTSNHRSSNSTTKKKTRRVKRKTKHPGTIEEQKGGRWEKWEHLEFLRGLRRIGRGHWKQIGETIPTRYGARTINVVFQSSLTIIHHHTFVSSVCS